MKKFSIILVSFILLLGIYIPNSSVKAMTDTEEFCKQFEGISKIWWDGIELKPGQIGRLIVKQDTPLFKLDGEKRIYSRTLKAGEFYRIYAFKPGMLSVGGGYFVDRNTKVTYQTPSKTKLNAVKCINNKEIELSLKENIALNDEKVVLISGDRALGSGVLLSQSLIITNEHVINNNNNLKAYFINGEEYKIEGIVAKDKNKDLALVKLDKPINIRPVTLGSGKNVKKGDSVLAIGSPKGLQNSVSQGLISGIRVDNGVAIIQTTASITHGSSGGGLFNNKGKLIGITSSGFEGTDIYFAISVDELLVWKNFLSLGHNDIPVLKQEVPRKNLVGNMYTGMTKEEVKKSNIGYLINETEDMLTFEGINYFDHPVIEMYYFENNRLIDMAAFFTEADSFNNYEEATNFFMEIWLKIAKDKGYADYFDDDWENNKYDLRLEANWDGTESKSSLNWSVFNNEGEIVARIILYTE